MNGLSQYDQDRQLESIARRILDALEIVRSPAPIQPSNVEQEELRSKLLEFLSQYSRWWFNAIRIHGWGSDQPGFKLFGEHSAHQITSGLEELVQEQKIVAKLGKKSRVYKAK